MAEEVSWASLKQAADDATKPLDPGTYDFKVEKAEFKFASTGSPMINVNLAVQGGPKHGKSLLHNFVLSMGNGFALGMFFRSMAAFGLDDSFFAQLPSDINQSMSIIAQQLMGRNVRAEVGIRADGAYKGRNEFKAFEPTTAVGGFPMPASSPAVPTGLPGVPATLAVPGVPSVPSPAPVAASAPAVSVPSIPSIPATPPRMAVATAAPAGVTPPPDDPF